jgi:hypothetical protein
MKSKETIGSEPSKTHYGGAPKNPATVKDSQSAENKDVNHISEGAQEANLKIRPNNKSKK